MTRAATALSISLAATLTLGAVQAQVRTFPPQYLNKPGPTLDQEPFGLDQCRQATFVDRSYLAGVPVGSKFLEVLYRREENRLDKVFSQFEPMRRQPTVFPVWEIKFGSFAGNFANLDPQYENRANQVTGFTTVFAGILNLQTNTPTLPPPPNPSVPAPFAIKFPFNVQQPLYAGHGVVVQHFVYEQRNRAHPYFVDAVHLTQPPTGEVKLINPTTVGCPKDFNRVHGTAPSPGAGSLNLHLFGAPPSVPGLAYFGTSASSWGGAPLPLNLGFMGLPGCNVYADLLLAIPTRTNVAGVADLAFPIPGNPALVGITAYNQWGVVDSRAGGSFAMSDGVSITLGNQVGRESILMSVISGEGQRANARVGFFQPFRGPVFQLRYQ